MSGCDSPEPLREEGPDRCSNHKDDDGDGFVDCEDQDCAGLASCRADAGPDARATVDADAGNTITCEKLCDCPEGTTCTIEGICSGAPCTKRCNGPEDCSCGRACIEGFCKPFFGTGTSCTHDCDCTDRQFCAGNTCVVACNREGFQCFDDETCAPCGKSCAGSNSICVDLGHCGVCSTDCPTTEPWQICADTLCVEPPGTRYAPLSWQSVPIGLTNVLLATVDVPAGVTPKRFRVFFEVTRGTSFVHDPNMNLIAPTGESVSFSSSGCGSDGRTRDLFPDTLNSGPNLEVFEGVPAGGRWKLYGYMLMGSANLERFALFIEE